MSSPEHPLVKAYACGKCGAKGVKLWRDYNTFLEDQELTCYACTSSGGDRNEKSVRCSIGWKVAAVPTPDNSTFWGYTSVPADAAAWWWGLPVEVSGG